MQLLVCMLKLILCFIIFIRILFCHHALANPVMIAGDVIIDKTIHYNNVTLDMRNASFHIINHATLHIENCKIIGTISPHHPQLIKVGDGTLLLNDNTFQLQSEDIIANPMISSLYHVIEMVDGNMHIINNTFTINTAYTVGFITTKHNNTTGLIIRSNAITNFHGGIMLINSDNFNIINNTFLKISDGNIFIINGRNGNIADNNIFFSGNNNIGDSIDIVDSTDINIINNYVLAGSCYAIVILRGQDILVMSNHIVSGITYAIFIKLSLPDINKFIGPYQFKLQKNKNIKILKNYFSQNRYGLTASDVDGLTVQNNIFIQKFSNAETRKFWTDNDVLLKDIHHLDWQKNRYKEAYTQNDTDNSSASKFVEFPISGGVVF